MFKMFDRIYNKQISSKGLGIFRIFFFLNLLLEVIRIFRYRHLYFDPIPFVEESILSKEFIWYVWFAVLVSIIIGFKTRFAAIVNYILFITLVLNNSHFEYHMDYSYVGVSFLAILLPLSKSYSLENLLLRIKYSSKNNVFIPQEFVAKYYYYLLLLVGVSFVYFDSLFFKFKDIVWMGGIGMWLPASLPQITILNDQWLLNQKYLMFFLGYLTIVFELLFSLFFWVKKTRVLFFIVGFGLHFGILLEFPIPFFALGVISLYLLLIPLKFWNWLESKIVFKKTKLTFYYDEECPLCLRVKIIITFFDVFNAIEFKGVQSSVKNVKILAQFTEEELLENIYSIDSKSVIRTGVDTYFKVFRFVPLFYFFSLFRVPGLYSISKSIYNWVAKNRDTERCTFDTCGLPTRLPQFFNKDDVKILNNFTLGQLKRKCFLLLLSFFVFLQVIVSFDFLHYNYVNRNFDKGSTASSYLNTFKGIQRNIRSFSHEFFGITKHGVFISNHFKNYNNIYTLKYNGKFLPIINELGMPGKYLKGGLWVNYSWKVNGRNVNVNNGSIDRLESGLSKYASYWSNNNQIIDPVFELVVKRIETPFKWEKNLLTKNLNSPWKKVGTAEFNSTTGSFKISIDD